MQWLDVAHNLAAHYFTMFIKALKLLFVLSVVALAACTNNPYPQTDNSKKILYSSFSEAPRTLDPAVAYTTSARTITDSVYGTLLEYHYLKRPYELMPSLARALPELLKLPNGGAAYLFKIRDNISFQTDPCFSESDDPAIRKLLTRKVTAEDFIFQLMRLADPAVNSPISSNFSVIAGFDAFSKRLAGLRKRAAGFAALPIRDQYKRAGPIAGISSPNPLELKITLSKPDPQILYWFAMPFTTPVPWEAIQHYDGKEGRDRFADHPVGTGPYKIARYEKQHRIILQRSPTWYGRTAEAAQAPGAFFPAHIDRADVQAGYVSAAYAGRRMPFLDYIYFTREREGIPRFNKFLQGYYDNGGIVKESFDAVVQSDDLSPEMAAKGMRLDQTVQPSIFYLGFNMDDNTVGSPAKERGRKLRQAMSLAIDVEQYLTLFHNGRGVAAQSPIPPGLWGYDKTYRNPYRRFDLAKARRLMKEAGYRGGVDPATGEALVLTFDTQDTSAQGKLQYQYFVSSWRRLGINVEVEATTYNQFQQKIRNGDFQIFTWGWIADYPDPENFMFLLECASSRSRSGGPNSANFCHREYDKLFHRMKDLENTPERMQLIKKMRTILETERPWIELFHRESYSLSHAWVSNSKPMGLSLPAYKYLDVEPELRARSRAEWNPPVIWPALALLFLVIAAVVPAVRTFYRERQ